MHPFNTTNSYTVLLAVYVRLQELSVQVVHIRIIQILIEFHPFAAGNLARTHHNRVCLINRRKRHYNIQIGATEIEAMRMPNANQTLETCLDTCLLEYLTNHSVNKVLTYEPQ